VVKIVEAMPQKDIIFIPDKLMGQNMRGMTSKNIILWNGTCIVHDHFTPETVEEVKKLYPGVRVLAHTECEPAVIGKVDMAGSTSQMLDYVSKTDAKTFMLVTECGLSDRVRAENRDKEIVGTCNLCPYMKKIALKDVLTSLKEPSLKQAITIPEGILKRAKRSLDRMFALEREYDAKKGHG